jgi:hypothetical protein
VEDDVPIDLCQSQDPSALSFGGAHRGRVCVCIHRGKYIFTFMRFAFVPCFSKNHFELCSLVFFDLNKLDKQSPHGMHYQQTPLTPKTLVALPTQHAPARPLIPPLVASRAARRG